MNAQSERARACERRRKEKLCRQIIREHDDHFRHIGCRIKAEPTAEGHAIWFTLPREGE